MRLLCGPSDGPVAVILPGTASTGEFVARAVGPALSAFGIGLVSGDLPPGGDDQTVHDTLEWAARRWRPVLVGGVSRGAHLAVRWAATRPAHRPAGLLLALPAWTGSPGPVAAASAATAAEVERHGVPATLTAIAQRSAAYPAAAWVVEELVAAWPRHSTAQLAATLRATSTSAGPSSAELAALDVPAGVFALRDDPLHPADVAREWVASIGRASLVSADLAAVGRDRATIGRGVLLAWLRARAALSRSR